MVLKSAQFAERNIKKAQKIKKIIYKNRVKLYTMKNKDIDTGKISKAYEPNETSTDILGVNIILPTMTMVSIHEGGYKITYFEDTVIVIIGIGKDHTAELLMTKRAWEALNDGKSINITIDVDPARDFSF